MIKNTKNTKNINKIQKLRKPIKTKKYNKKQLRNKTFKNYKNYKGGLDEPNKLQRVEDVPYSYFIITEQTNKSNKVIKVNVKMLGKYSGPWKFNMPYNTGKFTLDTGAIYEGQWLNGIPNGKGVYNFTRTGNKYIGNFQDGHIDGNGKFFFNNGDVYEGQFKNGAINGYGTFNYINGNVYEGQLKNGLLNGNGVLTYGSGDKYTGEFKNNRRNGYGVIKYINGHQYEGQWLNGEKDGIGTFITNSREYTGMWKNNAPNGEGQMTFYKTGVILKGLFRTTQNNGNVEEFTEGTAYYTDGSTYTGVFIDYEKDHGTANPEGEGKLADNYKFNIQYGFIYGDPVSITDTELL
jgi:hypothetical protein